MKAVTFVSPYKIKTVFGSSPPRWLLHIFILFPTLPVERSGHFISQDVVLELDLNWESQGALIAGSLYKAIPQMLRISFCSDRSLCLQDPGTVTSL